MNDARFPWLLLIPEIRGLREIHALEPARRAILIEEIAQASTALQQATGAEKINMGALGNIVAQLHIHVVARFEKDAAWPGPVWGSGAPRTYEPQSLETVTIKLFRAFAALGIALKET
jgi:diadenosine tetraphosphate (Ap4A) HIT family hydrolase